MIAPLRSLQTLWATMMKILSGKRAAIKSALPPLSDPLASRILMFHDICPDDSALTDEYACTLSQLFTSIRAHKAMGFTFVSLDQLMNMEEAEALRGKCVLTFDDGYARLFTLAAPALTADNIPFTAYICTNFLDTPGYLSREDLQQLSQNPLCTIGSHGCSHSMTRFMKKKALKFELTHSRTLLQSLLGRNVRHFAFPYGSAYACSNRDCRLAQTSGYATAALTTPMPISSLSTRARFRLPRINMPNISEETVK